MKSFQNFLQLCFLTAFVMTFVWMGEVSALLPSRIAKTKLDKHGDGVSVWGATNEIPIGVIKGAVFHNGHWLSPETISSDTVSSFAPELAVSTSAGNAVAVWLAFDLDSGVSFLQAAKLPKDGSWTDPVTISKTDGSEVSPNDYIIEISNDDENTVVVTWNSIMEGIPVIRSASSRFNGNWKSPKTISD